MKAAPCDHPPVRKIPVIADACATSRGWYYRARYYHPQLQRFISEDALGFEGGHTNLYAYVANAPVNFADPTGMYLAPGTIPPCRDPFTIPLTPELSGRKGLLAQVIASELTLLGIVWDVLGCGSMLPGPGAGIVGGARGGAQSVANATRLARQLTSEAQVAELLAGGGRVIAGPGSKVPLRDAARLAREYGGATENWVKVTSTRPSAFQTHAYRNVVTGQVVEPKTNLMLQNFLWW